MQMHTGNSSGALSPLHTFSFLEIHSVHFHEREIFFPYSIITPRLFIPLRIFLVRKVKRLLSYSCFHRADPLFPQLIVCIFILSFCLPFLITVIPGLIGVITWNSANKQ